ncbi:MAG TPA: hypothetical protein VKZ89_00035 [Thermobifida alba]|nr:hypothetical protein [Thermobifida alba]
MSGTHWHLAPAQLWAVHDPARFDRPPLGRTVAATPREVADWLDEQVDKLVADPGAADLAQSGLASAEGRDARRAIRLRLAENERDVCALLAVRGARIAHFGAYVCSASHSPTDSGYGAGWASEEEGHG